MAWLTAPPNIDSDLDTCAVIQPVIFAPISTRLTYIMAPPDVCPAGGGGGDEESSYAYQ